MTFSMVLVAFQSGETRLLCWTRYSSRIQVQGHDVTLATGRDYFFVKPLSRFAAQPFVFYHGFDEIGQFKKFMPFVVLAVFVYPVGHVYEGIQAHNVNGSEGSRLRPSDDRPR